MKSITVWRVFADFPAVLLNTLFNIVPDVLRAVAPSVLHAAASFCLVLPAWFLAVLAEAASTAYANPADAAGLMVVRSDAATSQAAVAVYGGAHKSQEAYAYVTGFLEEGGRIFVELDFVQVKENVQNGFDIINQNPKLRVFELARESYPDCDGAPLFTHEIWRIWEQAEYFDTEKLLYFIKVDEGIVTEFYRQHCVS